MGDRPADATEAIETYTNLKPMFTLEQEIFILIKRYAFFIYNSPRIYNRSFEEDVERILEEFINKYKELCQTHQH